ncbi:S-layer homology domain-containing protein [Peptoniphilus raoultii]|uniref:S-layer homology domain-containing protein n=1 Tax=Peptoniphilus raoultii TaxID=1776387 RepID=UPI0008DA26EB|nr:S-layer homology domain-containing protein [Peptoniphilus raoultii]
MKKYTTRLFAVLPAALMLLPLTSMDAYAEFSNNEIKACDLVKIASKNSLAKEYVNLNTKENILHNNKFTLKVETDAKNSTRSYFFVGVDKGMRFNAFAEKNDIDLEDVKKKAKEEVDKLENLSQEQRDTLKDEINSKTSEKDINKVVKKGKLQDKKIEATKKVDNLKNLTDKQKADHKHQISIKDNETSVNDELYKAEVQDLKEEYKKNIEKMEFLTREQKEYYKKQIDKETSKIGVNGVYNVASGANDGAKVLKETQEKAKDTIEKLTYLAKDKKESYKSDIDNAGTVYGVEQILARAKKEDKKAKEEKETKEKEEAAKKEAEVKKLQEAKANAKEEISGLKYLENKETYTKQITEATEISRVNEILVKAREENNTAKEKAEREQKEKEELQEAKANAKEEISGLKYLENKETYTKQITEATEISKVNEILVKAREENNTAKEKAEKEQKEKEEAAKKEAEAKKLQEAKAKAKEEISKLEDLGDEKQSFIDKVELAKTEEAVQTITEEAKTKAAEKKVNPKPKDKEPQIIIPSRRDNDFRISHSHSKTYPVKTGAIIMAKENSKESPQNVIDNKLGKKAEDKIVYKDIKGHWAERQIKYALEQNYFKDIVKGNDFKPNEKITRAEFVTILGRRAGIDPSTFELKKFKDVDSKKYYSLYIAWALENKIVFGIDEDTFAPDKEMTREEMAAFLVRFKDLINLNLKEEKEGKNFKDAKEISTWAKDSVEKLSKLNIIEGMGDGKFSPKTNLTRAQIASVIDKIK